MTPLTSCLYPALPPATPWPGFHLSPAKCLVFIVVWLLAELAWDGAGHVVVCGCGMRSEALGVVAHQRRRPKTFTGEDQILESSVLL